MTVTRDVILDLWPAYAAGEVSADTRALVEEYLRTDPELAQQLHEPVQLPDVPAPSPDAGTRSFEQLRRRLRGHPWLLQFAGLFTALSFARIVSDTSWDVSPKKFIITLLIAVGFWTAYFISLWRMRARILILPGKRR